MLLCQLANFEAVSYCLRPVVSTAQLLNAGTHCCWFRVSFLIPRWPPTEWISSYRGWTRPFSAYALGDPLPHRDVRMGTWASAWVLWQWVLLEAPGPRQLPRLRIRRCQPCPVMNHGGVNTPETKGPVGIHGPTIHSLGMLYGAIQGAEESAAFFHHTMEMHFVEKVALGIAEVLCTKPAQRREERTCLMENSTRPGGAQRDNSDLFQPLPMCRQGGELLLTSLSSLAGCLFTELR